MPGESLFERQYPLPKGMSYNSYLIADDKIAIMDSVETGGATQWIRQIEAAAGNRCPDYLVVHHMEPDHSACIMAAMDKWPTLTLVASQKAIAMLPQFFPGNDMTGRTLVVRQGDTLPLGHHMLHFFAAPMIHWPEVMVSYEEHDHILFSADAFGKFGALQFDDNWIDEARRYYINIVGKLFNECADFRRTGSAALDLAYVAAGRVDGFFEIGLRPWDFAAGELLVREAGGIVSDFTGGHNYMLTGNIVAGNPRVVKAMLANMRDELSDALKR